MIEALSRFLGAEHLVPGWMIAGALLIVAAAVYALLRQGIDR